MSSTDMNKSPKKKPEPAHPPKPGRLRKPLLFVALAVASGVCCSILYEQVTPPTLQATYTTGTNANTMASSGYRYINPTIPYTGPILETKPFKQDIEAYTAGVVAMGKASRMTVQFREMDNGYSFTVNGKELYFPASLMKVHTMVLLLYKEMKKPGFLQQTAYFDPAKNITSRNEYGLKPGATYTVKQLLEAMIINSDNMATTLLHDFATLPEISRFYHDIGLKVPMNRVEDGHALDDFMQVSDYTKIIRMLYNAAYLSKELSDYALSLLEATNFKIGLYAGLEPGFQLSHKYGVWKKNGKTQLHDCGILYHNGKAYLLAVMTEGTDEYILADAIGGVARLVCQRLQHKIAAIAG